jgi:hypothetical protein
MGLPKLPLPKSGMLGRTTVSPPLLPEPEPVEPLPGALLVPPLEPESEEVGVEPESPGPLGGRPLSAPPPPLEDPDPEPWPDEVEPPDAAPEPTLKDEPLPVWPVAVSRAPGGCGVKSSEVPPTRLFGAKRSSSCSQKGRHEPGRRRRRWRREVERPTGRVIKRRSQS